MHKGSRGFGRSKWQRRVIRIMRKGRHTKSLLQWALLDKTREDQIYILKLEAKVKDLGNILDETAQSVEQMKARLRECRAELRRD